ncbi:MAG: hypothetical protein V7785_13185 [Bermanella sp.]
MKHWLKKPIVLPVFILLGFLALMIIKSGKPAPTASTIEEYATPAEIQELKETSITPIAIGYGTAKPSSNLNVPAEVSAEITWIHPKLKQGGNLKIGTEVVKFDTRDIELALSKVQADLTSQNTRVAELDLEERNAAQQLQLSLQKYELAKGEFERKKALSKQGAIATSTLDTEARNLINQETELENMKLQLALYPKQRELLGSEIKIAHAQIEEQERNLSRTRVFMPFNARIGSVNVEKGSFISKGSTLFVAQGKNNMEVLTQIPAKKMLPLLSHAIGKKVSDDSANLKQKLGLEAKVYWVDGPSSAFWAARVLRSNDSIDSKTRSLGLIIGIENTVEQERVGIRPPLFKGMYLKVEITGNAVNAIKVPRSAIHQGSLYLKDSDNRLVIEKAKIAFVQGDYAVLSQAPSLNSLILTDLIPAVPNMLLLPILGIANNQSLKP